MSVNYESEFKKKIVRLHLEEGRTLKSIQEEYGVSKASISIWVKQLRNECQANAKAQEEKVRMPEMSFFHYMISSLQDFRCHIRIYLLQPPSEKHILLKQEI